jgi:isocitrate lyase
MPDFTTARSAAAAELDLQWSTDPRWRGVQRTYSAADVVRLRGSVTE